MIICFVDQQQIDWQLVWSLNHFFVNYLENLKCDDFKLFCAILASKQDVFGYLVVGHTK